MISDMRRLVIHRVDVVNGSMIRHPAGMAWQTPDGEIGGCGSWKDLLIAYPEDLASQAKAKQISTLEWLRRRLASIPYMAVEIADE